MPSPLLDRLAALAVSDRPAIVAADATLSHRELAQRADVLARHLLADHGRPSLDGARVALLALPSAAWLIGFVAVLRAGGVVVPLAPSHPELELRHVLRLAAPVAFLADATHHDRAVMLAAAPVITLADTLTEPVANIEHDLTLPGRDARDGGLLLTTSGTTGKPKGALLTHANLATQTRLIGEAWGMTDQDRLLHALPLHHMHGVVIALLTAFLAGGSVALRPRFDASEIWETMADVTVWMGVPTMVHRLLEAYDRADAATQARWARSARQLRLAVSGSAALPVTLAERWRAIAEQIPLERFGMTELGVALSNPLRGPRKAGFVGPALPGVSVQEVDERGEAVKPGEPGEIQVRGGTVFAGYLGDEEATERAFRDGWFLTGDTATVDDEGAVKILGRTSVDILKSGGYKLSALEIEEALREHPAVADAAVVGVPDETWGQRVEAAVVLHAGASTTPDELTRFCRERLAPYKVPRRVVVMAELPRNLMGKVVKAAVERALADHP